MSNNQLIRSRSGLSSYSPRPSTVLGNNNLMRLYFTEQPNRNLDDDSGIRDPTIISQIQATPIQPQKHLLFNVQEAQAASQDDSYSCIVQPEKLTSMATIIKSLKNKFQIQNQVNRLLIEEKYVKDLQYNWNLSSSMINLFEKILMHLAYLLIPMYINNKLLSLMLILVMTIILLLLLIAVQYKHINGTITQGQYFIKLVFLIFILFSVVIPSYTIQIISFALSLVCQYNWILCRFRPDLNVFQFALYEIMYLNLIFNLYQSFFNCDLETAIRLTICDGVILQYMQIIMGEYIAFEINALRIIVKLLSLIIQIYLIVQFIKSLFLNKQIPILFRFHIVDAYLNQNNVPHHIKETLMEKIQELHFDEIDKNQETINNAFQALPQSINNDLNMQIRRQVLKQMQILQIFSQDVSEYLAEHGEMLQLQTNVCLNQEQEYHNSLYILIKGKLEIKYSAHGTSVRIAEVGQIYIVGMDVFLENLGHQLQYTTLCSCQFIKISHQVFRESIRRNHKDSEQFHSLLNRISNRVEVGLLIQSCLICKSIDHHTTKCSQLHYIPDQFAVIEEYLYTETQYRKQYKRLFDCRISSLNNREVVHQTALRYRNNNQIDIEEVEIDSARLVSSATNPTSVLDKQNDYPSGQTWKDLVGSGQDLESGDLKKQRMYQQSPAFQDESNFLTDGIVYNIPKPISQSNTFKSSSGNTMSISQKSQTKLVQRPNDPKITFQYTADNKNQFISQDNQQQIRIGIRAQTHQSQRGQLPVVSEENSQSQLNLPFSGHIPSQIIPSGVSISSIGHSPDEHHNWHQQTTLSQRLAHKLTMISPRRRSESRKSVIYQYQSDFEIGTNRHLFRDEFDIDTMHQYQHYCPKYNIDNVVANLLANK